VSLLGRLEDLSLTDIVQIVFLSRRTGVLEIVDDRGRHTVLFRGGLIVNASSPDHSDLLTFLVQKGLLTADNVKTLRQMEEGGIPYGTAALELNLVKQDVLADAIRDRIVDVVTPLMNSREGEFNFILSDSMSAIDVEYEPDALFKEGGIEPQKVLGGGEGEKIKPLRGLEESLKAGKALLRGASAAESTPATLNLGLGQPIEASPSSGASSPPKLPRADAGFKPADTTPTDNVVPFPSQEKTFEPIPDEEPPAEAPAEASRPRSGASGQFKVSGGLFDIETPEAQYRNVVLFERNPLVRVAAKRAFTKRNVKTFQYGSLEDVRNAMTDLFRSNSFFVTFLELTGDDASQKLMQQVKRRNPRLPVVLVDSEADLRRRHDLLRAGADLYLTKPSAARLQPGLAEEELALFADELVLFSERAFEQWEQVAGGFGAEAGKKFYEAASKDSMDRSFTVLKQLINELSNPNDISQVSATILRLSAEYLDRGALFMASEGEFVGLGGFGITGAADDMDTRVKRVRVARNAPSVLSEVAQSGEAHRGKMKKTDANVELINGLGGVLPTEVVALPIIHSGRAIGILYGDNAEHRAPIDSVTGLEIFLSQAGYAFGNAVFASERAGRS
jgi:CheY-like chemotaxis protein